jgi:hypothetical protein
MSTFEGTWLAYIKVNPNYHRQGVGRWAIESLLKSEALAVNNHPWALRHVYPLSGSFFLSKHCSYFFNWATSVNESNIMFEPSVSKAEFNAKKQGVNCILAQACLGVPSCGEDMVLWLCLRCTASNEVHEGGRWCWRNDWMFTKMWLEIPYSKGHVMSCRVWRPLPNKMRAARLRRASRQ